MVMGVSDGARDFRHQPHALVRRAVQRWYGRAQISARRVFHAEKRQAVLAFADLVNRKNVWMIEAGGCFRFALEAHERLV